MPRCWCDCVRRTWRSETRRRILSIERESRSSSSYIVVAEDQSYTETGILNRHTSQPLLPSTVIPIHSCDTPYKHCLWNRQLSEPNDFIERPSAALSQHARLPNLQKCWPILDSSIPSAGRCNSFTRRTTCSHRSRQYLFAGLTSWSP